MKERQKMKPVLCPRCNGKGYIVRIDWRGALFTLGLSLLDDLSHPPECPACMGFGYILQADDSKDIDGCPTLSARRVE